RLSFMLTRHRSLHEISVASKPNQPCKPSSYWIAVLKAEKLPSDPSLGEVDFLWIKCNGVSIAVCGTALWNEVLTSRFLRKSPSKPSERNTLVDYSPMK